MYCANSMKRLPKLSKFCFNSVNIPSHKSDNINAFFTVSADEVFSRKFKSCRKINTIKIFVTVSSFFEFVFSECFICKKNTKVIQDQICIYFLF